MHRVLCKAILKKSESESEYTEHEDKIGQRKRLEKTLISFIRKL